MIQTPTLKELGLQCQKCGEYKDGMYFPDEGWLCQEHWDELCKIVNDYLRPTEEDK